MKRKLKQPPLTTGKYIPASALEHAAVSSDNRPPSFSFQFLHPGYCITKCTDKERLSFVDRMFRLRQSTWAELRQAPRHGLGYEVISRTSLRGGVPAGITEDVNFIAFRFHGKKAMVGFRSREGAFNIVWFDRDFTLYDHGV